MSNQAVPEVRAYEVLGTLNLGFKPQIDKKAPREIDIRTAPATVTDEELRAVGMSDDDINSLLTHGSIADPDAPTRPSLASLYAAHSLAARLARHFGLLRLKGAEHVFDGQSFQGVQAFREGVTLEHLERAIQAAWDEVAA